MYVFLDESGDLGFNFTKGGTSRFFVICLLVVPTTEDYKQLSKAVERTIRHKLHKGRPPKQHIDELKGSKITLPSKEYFFRQAQKSRFSIYSLVLNKARVYEELRHEPGRLYNFIARTLIERCPFREEKERIILTLDKRMATQEISNFNQYLLVQLQEILPITVPFEIFHCHSWERKGLQAVDLFSWGMFRKYERNDLSWYSTFQGKIAFENVYLP